MPWRVSTSVSNWLFRTIGRLARLEFRKRRDERWLCLSHRLTTGPTYGRSVAPPLEPPRLAALVLPLS